MKNYHAIIVKYLGATDTKGARVKLVSGRFEDSVTFAYDYAKNHVTEMAEDWLIEHGQKIVGQCEITGAHDVIILGAINHLFTPLKEMELV